MWGLALRHAAAEEAARSVIKGAAAAATAAAATAKVSIITSSSAPTASALHDSSHQSRGTFLAEQQPSQLARQLHATQRWQPITPLPSPFQARSMSTLEKTDTPSAATPDSQGPAGPLARYQEGVRTGIYRKDARQAVTVQKLQHLYDALGQHVSKPNLGRRRKSGLTLVEPVHSKPKTSWWKNIISGGDEHEGDHDDGSIPTTRQTVKGLYMYGGVGCGKTMLMDLFVASAPPEFKVLRTHFHDFMLDVHSKLRHYKSAPDPLLRVADHIAQHCKVLAMDEFFVTDVADAMILSRLFGRLWDRGVVLVATSNRAPDKLYENGLQRVLFLPFIHRLKVECDSHDMASPTDYRRLAKHQRGLYFTNAEREKDLQEEFEELADGATPAKATIEVMMGRKLEVPLSADKVCMFNFEDLCGRPVAAADYIAIAERYHTMAISDVPVFVPSKRSEAYRFMTLIDVMYEHRIRLLMSAEAMPFELFERVVTQQQITEKPELADKKDVIVDDNLGFTKDRTISRMLEMQSLEYLVAHAKAYAPGNILALEEILSKTKAAGLSTMQEMRA